MDTDKVKSAMQSHRYQPQHTLHVQLPIKIVEKMLEEKYTHGVTMRDQIIQALELKGIRV